MSSAATVAAKLQTSRLRCLHSANAHSRNHSTRGVAVLGFTVARARRNPLSTSQLRTAAAAAEASKKRTKAARFCWKYSDTAGELLVASNIAETVRDHFKRNPMAFIQSGTLRAIKLSRSQRKTSDAV